MTESDFVERSADILAAQRVMRRMPAVLRSLLVEAEMLRLLSDLLFQVAGFQQRSAEQVRDLAASSASQARAVEVWTEAGDTMSDVWPEIRVEARSRLRDALGVEFLGLLGVDEDV